MKNNKWLRLLAYVNGMVNQQLLLQNEYLAAENRILRAHLPKRLRLTDEQRSTLAEIGKARTDDHEAKRDATYPAQPLAQQGVDDAVAAGLRDRLAALGRALQRLEDGSYGRSIRLACCCANFPLRQSSSGLSQESQSTGHGESCFIGDYFGLAISGMKV